MTDVPFVGRDAEIRVPACLADAGRGRGHALLLGGERDIGETRFVEAAIAEARTLGFAIAVGTCDPPWRQVYRAGERGRAAPPGRSGRMAGDGRPRGARGAARGASRRGNPRRPWALALNP